MAEQKKEGEIYKNKELPKAATAIEKKLDEAMKKGEVEAPNIKETIERAKNAVKMAQKQAVRRHKCAICGVPECPHYQREDMDTGERFNSTGPDRDAK